MSKIELIQWVDSFGCGSRWQEMDSMKDRAVLYCHSVGFVIKETDDYVVIVPHRAVETEQCEEQGCGDMTIPKVCITSREILTVNNLINNNNNKE